MTKRKTVGAFRPHERVTAPIGGASRTKQSFKDESDANSIVERYRRTGTMERGRREPVYMDVPSVTDFHEAVLLSERVMYEFSRLPAVVRDACDNDPGRYLELVDQGDPELAAVMRQAGFLVAEATEARTEAEELPGTSPLPDPVSLTSEAPEAS